MLLRIGQSGGILCLADRFIGHHLNILTRIGHGTIQGHRGSESLEHQSFEQKRR